MDSIANTQDSNAILLVSNDDSVAYTALNDMQKQNRWERFKQFYLNIHKITEAEEKESRIRIGEERINEWVNSKNNIFKYKDNNFIKAEIRYYKIQGEFYKEFMQNPYNYVNTCAARMSKALNDFGISVKKLQGMKNNAYPAYSGTNNNPTRTLVRVGI